MPGENIKPVRIGVMSFAHLHADSYTRSVVQRKDTELVGIADHDDARAQAKAAQFGTAHFSTYEALLAIPDLDAVIIASENARHRELTEMAARAGKHVLCEKPLATTVEDAEAMIAACKQAGVQLMTAFPCRFSPVFARLKAAIDSGRAGKVVAFRGTNRGRNPGGWFNDANLAGGGAVIDHTVHVTDLARWLLGEEVREVYAEISNGIGHADYDDVGFLSMTFQNGVFGTLDASWSRPKAFPTWGDVTLDVITERGTLTMDMFAQNLVHYSNTSDKVAWYGWGDNMDDGLVGAFAAAIREGQTVPITGEDGLAALRVALAAYASAEQGQTITLS